MHQVDGEFNILYMTHASLLAKKLSAGDKNLNVCIFSSHTCKLSLNRQVLIALINLTI